MKTLWKPMLRGTAVLALLTAFAPSAIAQVTYSCPDYKDGNDPLELFDGITCFDVDVVWTVPCWCTDQELYRFTCYGPSTSGGVGNQCLIGGCNITDFQYCHNAEPPPPDDPERAEPQPPYCPVNIGEPIAVTTGDMFFSHTDGVVGTLSLARNYNSGRVGASRRYGQFGPGWNSTVELRLNVVTQYIIQARRADGHPLYYTDRDGDGVFVQEAPENPDVWIEALSVGGYTRVLRAGGSESYDDDGTILSAVDASGVTTTYSHDTSGRLTSISRLGRSLVFSYGGGSQATAVSDGNGTLLATYGYDGFRRLVTVDYPDGTGYRYDYNAAGRIVHVRDAAGDPVETHEYDAQGRAITSEVGEGREKYTLTYSADQTTVTDASGNTTVYSLADVGGVRRVTSIAGPCSTCGGSGGDTRSWTYDSDGRVVAYTDGASNSWTYTYDGDGRLLTETNPLSEATVWTYDAQGRVATRQGPDGSLVTYAYGPSGPTAITEKVDASTDRTTNITYGALGLPTDITDPRGKTTTLTYDTHGDLASVTDPLDNTTTFAYDALGRRTTVTDPLSNTTTTAYDVRGRVVEITNADATTTAFGYDRSGRRTSVRDPLGRITRYAYDIHGRLERVTDPAGGTTRYAYDIMSNLISLTDAEGNTTTFTYDNHHRVSAVTYPGGATESYTYDTAGRLATRTDRRSVVTTYSYDAAGRLTGKTYSDGTPAVAYTYDAAGRLATASNGGDSLTWTYDLAGQLLSEASTANGSLVEYVYDPGGNRVSLSLNGGLFVSYAYDDASRLTTITKGTDDFAFTYDDASRRSTMTYPNGVVTAYGYDDLSRLTSIAAARGATPITGFDYTYDDAGNRTQKAALDHVEDYAYDALYRLVRVERTGTGANRWRYDYDRVGNRTVEQVGDGDLLGASYNQRNQLLEGTVGGSLLVRGSLDEAGSVTVNGAPARMLEGNVFEAEIDSVPGTNTFTVEATDTTGNVTTQDFEVEVSGSGATYQYDPNGNLIERTENGEVWDYVWNAENQLIRVCKDLVAPQTCDSDGVAVASFKYDPLGRRIQKAVPGATMTFVYDKAAILRRGGSPEPTHHFVHAPGMDEPLVSEQLGGGVLFLHADALGSIVQRTDSLGAAVGGVTYDPWGQIETGAAGDSFAYTGREWDEQTGLYYYRARYYDPNAARFISDDPLTSAGTNLYAYGRNNPIRFKDPMGWQATAPSPTPLEDITVPELTDPEVPFVEWIYPFDKIPEPPFPQVAFNLCAPDRFLWLTEFPADFPRDEPDRDAWLVFQEIVETECRRTVPTLNYISCATMRAFDSVKWCTCCQRKPDPPPFYGCQTQ